MGSAEMGPSYSHGISCFLVLVLLDCRPLSVCMSAAGLGGGGRSGGADCQLKGHTYRTFTFLCRQVYWFLSVLGPQIMVKKGSLLPGGGFHPCFILILVQFHCFTFESLTYLELSVMREMNHIYVHVTIQVLLKVHLFTPFQMPPTTH